MRRVQIRALLTAAALAGCAVMLGACVSSSSKAPRTAQPAAAPAATPDNAISAAPPAKAPSRREAAAAKVAPAPVAPAPVAAAPRPFVTSTAALPPVTNPSENACAPAPQPVESSTGSTNVRVKDCKRNQFVLLPASLQSLIDGYVAECSAKCAPK